MARTAGRWLRQVLEEPARNPFERLLAVGVRGIELGQDRERHAAAVTGEERDLMVDPPGSGRPATLEVEVPTAGLDPSHPPALRGRDRRQEVLGVAAVAL